MLTLIAVGPKFQINLDDYLFSFIMTHQFVPEVKTQL